MCDLEGLRRGDEGAWAALEERYLRRIYFYVRKQIANHQTCEDLVQETFLGAVRGIGGFDDRYSMEQFLFGIARNKVIDHLRRRKRSEVSLSGGGEGAGESGGGLERILPGPGEAPSRLAREGERTARERRVLARILRRLVEKYWERGEFHKLETMELIFLENLPYRRIAEEVGLRDERAVAGIKFQAIQDLQRFAMREDPRHTLFESLWRVRGGGGGVR